jgi:hypothetical protein
MSQGGTDFDVAKAIADLLRGLDNESQQRVLRWVSESLGLATLDRVSANRNADKEPHADLLGPALGETPPGQVRSTNIKSFVEAKSPKSDNQFATVIAYFYRFEAPADQRREAITSEVLQNAARLAGRARLSNPLMTLNNAKKQGYLDAAGERGAFCINSVGENLVAMTLPGTPSDPKPKRRAAKRPTKVTRKRTSKGKAKKPAKATRRRRS